jgi:hypothetical protein
MGIEATASLEKETKQFARYKFDEPTLGTIYVPLLEIKSEFGEVPQNITVTITEK